MHTHTRTSLHTHPAFSQKKKIFPRKHFQKLSFYLRLSHRQVPRESSIALPLRGEAGGALAHSTDAERHHGPRQGRGPIGLPRAMCCTSPHITREFLAPNSHPRRDRLAVRKGPRPLRWAAPLPAQEPGRPAEQWVPRRRAGCPHPHHPPPVHPANLPSQQPGPEKPGCLRARWLPPRPPR